MPRAPLWLCLVAIVACGDVDPSGRPLVSDSPISVFDAPLPAPDAPTVSPDAPVAAPDAPCLDCPCVRAPLTMLATPRTSPPTAANTATTFDVALTNNDTASCPPSSFELRTRLLETGITLTPTNVTPSESGPLPGGATAHLTISAQATESFEGQRLSIPFDVSVSGSPNILAGDTVDLRVAEPPGCHVSVPRELMITDLSVVEDPVRTDFTAPAGDPRTGAWTFRRLVENMAPTPADAPAMVETLLATFATTQTLNSFQAAPRRLMELEILKTWRRLPGGALDLEAAPFRLLAIVNRFDLRSLDHGDAGEARFVFAFLGDGVIPVGATLIFEYKLPAASEADVLGWAEAFHALGALPLSEDYNVALQALTDRFAGRGARPSHPNGSAISAVRTNEIDFGEDGNWELREFGLSPTSGMLVPRPVELTPDASLNHSDTLARFVNANAGAILADQHTVPDLVEGQPFRAAASLNDGPIWSATGILDNEARHHFAVNTCNGCHAIETGTPFIHIGPRLKGLPSRLSGFLTGITVSDPITGEARTFNDIARRRADLGSIVCAQPAPAHLRQGITRVH